ncbi:MAG: GTPase ObgE [Actinomycetota bacterium]|nr:GTPase ObgE [Actinomycetota bacterium]
MSGFVDRAQLHVKAGDGGAGSVSFRREAHVDKGGPDGGDGGDGGDVILEATDEMVSLLSFLDQPYRKADSGSHGMGKARHGHRGKAIVVKMPTGTVVRDLEGNVVCDLHTAGMRYRAAKGGEGGRGNARFLANKRRAPSFAEQGEAGEEFWFNLELKLKADVALVGFPNAGKSTLISVISRAQPKIADYPFTTLKPNLGVVRYGGSGDFLEYVVADIPGLIEGASEGKGLGFEFLRHIERSRVLLFLLDGGEQGGIEVARQYQILRDELGNYMPNLLERPSLVVISKADLLDGDIISDTSTYFGLEVDFVISSLDRTNLAPLTAKMANLVADARNSTPVSFYEEEIVISLSADGFKVVKEGDGLYRVVGRVAERAVALSDVTTPDALEYIQTRLFHLGVYRELNRAGATDGDEVRIANFVFDYYRD